MGGGLVLTRSRATVERPPPALITVHNDRAGGHRGAAALLLEKDHLL